MSTAFETHFLVVLAISGFIIASFYSAQLFVREERSLSLRGCSYFGLAAGIVFGMPLPLSLGEKHNLIALVLVLALVPGTILVGLVSAHFKPLRKFFFGLG